MSDPVKQIRLSQFAEKFEEIAETPIDHPIDDLEKCFAAARSGVKQMLGESEGNAFIEATNPVHSSEPNLLETRSAIKAAAGAAKKILRKKAEKIGY